MSEILEKIVDSKEAINIIKSISKINICSTTLRKITKKYNIPFKKTSSGHIFAKEDIEKFAETYTHSKRGRPEKNRINKT